jgi:hypothetical protein
MATNESTATAYAFKPVRYSRPEVEHSNLAGLPVQRNMDTVEGVATGAASILRLIEWDEQREEVHETGPNTHPEPVLNNFQRGALLRLVAVNMDMLADQADDRKKWAYTQHTAESKTEEQTEALRLVKRCENVAKGQRA